MTRARLSAYLLPLAMLNCVLGACSNSGGTSGVMLEGAGASFPAPLYIKWFKAYNAAHPNVQVDYQSFGSGKGVNAVIDQVVDFGASDSAMTSEQIAKVDVGVQLLPMTAGSIVLAYNLEGIHNLQLSREAYAGIMLGKIKEWNDPVIAAANPGVTLPKSNINVVVRADGSGTTFVFTKHLSAISQEFAASPGIETSPNWSVLFTKSSGNEGISAAIHATPGSIGYIEYGYAKGTKLKMVRLENKAGKYIEPTIASAQATLASVAMPEDLVAWMPDPDGDQSYPIVTYTWLICYKKYADGEKAKALKEVLRYCLTDGQKVSELLGYVPLPEKVVQQVEAALANITGPEAAKQAE